MAIKNLNVQTVKKKPLVNKRILKTKLSEAALMLRIHNLISEGQLKVIWKEIESK